MSSNKGPDHVVVDGSNIATEGRSMPSLAQLSEAVAGFMSEHPDTAITVVVDATFGHRIDKREVKEFEAGISNNELVAPPAGAVGRGDAFVLGIADKASASVLSNDSFQEFHGEYEWLFDEGRLIGGKPVPHVGWVWVDRVPVRGPISRKATRGSGGTARRSSGGRSRRGSGRAERVARPASKEASEPLPKPRSPPPGRAAVVAPSSSTQVSSAQASSGEAKAAPKGGEPVNELMPFVDFVEHHPIGTSVNGTVDAYSSHGAYITIGDTDVRGYIPLRLMAEPAPRSAKSVMKIGESVTVVVVSFAPARRSIDCALPDLADDEIAGAASDELDEALPESEDASELQPSQERSSTKKAATKQAAVKKTSPKTTTAKRTAAKKTAAGETGSKTKKAAGKKTTAKRAAAGETVETEPAAEKTPAKRAATKKASSKKSGAKQASAKKLATKKTATKKTAKKKTAAKKSAAKKTAAKKTAAVEKTATKKKSASRKSSSKKPAAEKSTANDSAVKKTAASQSDDG